MKISLTVVLTSLTFNSQPSFSYAQIQFTVILHYDIISKLDPQSRMITGLETSNADKAISPHPTPEGAPARLFALVNRYRVPISITRCTSISHSRLND